MNLTTSKWLDAAQILGKDKNAKVQCPSCGIGILIVRDEEFDETQIDRYLICNNCGKWNVITNE